MPKQQAEETHAKTVERLFHAREFGHLRARKYGAAVIVESGPDDDVYKHMRLTRDGVHVWVLHFADRNGRSEPTPFRGQLGELVTLVADTFPWTIQNVHAHPERTQIASTASTYLPSVGGRKLQFPMPANGWATVDYVP